MQHTPIPWHLHDMEDSTLCGSNGDAIANTDAKKRTDEENQANAAHIVRCVNAHDELVAALTLASRYLECPEVQELPFALSASVALARARTALENATS